MIMKSIKLNKMFMIVSKDDYPVFEMNVNTLVKKKDYVQLHDFILHASLDVVDNI